MSTHERDRFECRLSGSMRRFCSCGWHTRWDSHRVDIAAMMTRHIEEETMRDDVTSGQVWPDDCEICQAPRTDAEAAVFGELCVRCAEAIDNDETMIGADQ